MLIYIPNLKHSWHGENKRSGITKCLRVPAFHLIHCISWDKFQKLAYVTVENKHGTIHI